MTHIVIDGTNILRGRNINQPLNCLVRLIIEILEKKMSFKCWFDASTRYELTRLDKTFEKKYDALLQNHNSYFFEVTGGIKADDFILQEADKCDCAVLSNDRYRDFATEYNWVLDDTNRLIKFNVLPNEIRVPKLGIMTYIRDDFDAEYNVLCNLLGQKSQFPRVPKSLASIPHIEESRHQTPVRQSRRSRMRRPHSIEPVSQHNQDSSTDLVKYRESDDIRYQQTDLSSSFETNQCCQIIIRQASIINSTFTLHGVMNQNVAVVNGGQFYLYGVVTGELYIAPGGIVYIYGMVLGHLYCSSGGYFVIYGMVNGQIIQNVVFASS